MPRYSIAIVGAGPAGYFAAQALQNLQNEELQFSIDLIERLPTPWGLVRSGVAPDHPKIKSVSKVFEKVATAGNVSLFGNVEVGKDISIDTLTEKYDAVVIATGTSIGKKLGIPGEGLKNSLSSAEFVPWYNGHPDFADLNPDLNCDTAVVIGAGKAGASMAQAFSDSWPADAPLSGLVVTRYDHTEEFMELVKKFWSAEEEFDHDGKFEKVKADGSAATDFSANAMSLATSVGLALQGLGLSEISINLSPVTNLREQVWARKSRWFLAAACTLVNHTHAAWRIGQVQVRTMRPPGSATRRARASAWRQSAGPRAADRSAPADPGTAPGPAAGREDVAMAEVAMAEAAMPEAEVAEVATAEVPMEAVELAELAMEELAMEAVAVPEAEMEGLAIAAARVSLAWLP